MYGVTGQLVFWWKASPSRWFDLELHLRFGWTHLDPPTRPQTGTSPPPTHCLPAQLITHLRHQNTRLCFHVNLPSIFVSYFW